MLPFDWNSDGSTQLHGCQENDRGQSNEEIETESTQIQNLSEFSVGHDVNTLIRRRLRRPPLLGGTLGSKDPCADEIVLAIRHRIDDNWFRIV